MLSERHFYPQKLLIGAFYPPNAKHFFENSKAGSKYNHTSSATGHLLRSLACLIIGFYTELCGSVPNVFALPVSIQMKLLVNDHPPSSQTALEKGFLKIIMSLFRDRNRHPAFCISLYHTVLICLSVESRRAAISSCIMRDSPLFP